MQMRRVGGAVLFSIVLLTTVAWAQTTLETVKNRGKLVCGVNTSLAGFATVGPNGKWRGFDVDYCRALAAAIFNDADKVEFRPLTAQARFTALQSKEIDVLSRNTTWTLSRDTSLGLNFNVTLFYDGQGLMVPAKLQAKSAKDLDGATICVQTGTTTELNLAEFFRVNKIKYEPVPIETNEEARTAYLAQRCDTYTTDASGLAATRATFDKPADHVILPEIISKEPLGPAVRHGDDQWADVVRWTVNALLSAEELGVTQANADDQSKNSKNPEVKRMLGTEGNLGGMMGLDKSWALRAVKAVGNYGEIFDRNIGPKTEIALARGLNAQWDKGGLQYSPPFR